MDKYTIFDEGGTATAVAPAREFDSLVDSVQRDLEATLQLLAERAQYLTGASGASIALREEGEMVCRAGAGRTAAEVGTGLGTNSGLSAECLRTLQIARCDDAESDPQANREGYQALGIKSAMVLPLLCDQKIVGLFELLADRASAFDEHDTKALIRLAELAGTAVEYAAAAERALPEISAEPGGEQAPIETAMPAAPEAMGAPELFSEQQPALVSAEIAQIGSCEACGFPVSQGRKWCVDCEQAGRSLDETARSADGLGRQDTWLQTHSYTLGALLIAALTIALLALKMR